MTAKPQSAPGLAADRDARLALGHATLAPCCGRIPGTWRQLRNMYQTPGLFTYRPLGWLLPVKFRQ